MAAGEMLDHVATFVRILNSTRTIELHQWDATSVERACVWAEAVKRIAAKAIDDGTEAVDKFNATIDKHLHGAGLPSGAKSEAITAHTLSKGARLVFDAVLSSPHLVSHPQRQRILSIVLTKIHKHQDSLSDREPASQLVDRELFSSRISAHKRSEEMAAVATVAAAGFRRARVQLHDRVLEFPCLTEYELSRRGLHLRALAKTLQTNVCITKSLHTEKYVELMDRITTQVQGDDKDVLEAVVWATLLPWPSETETAKSEMIKVVEEHAHGKQPAVYMSMLQPWLAALFASQSSQFASRYISALVHHGMLHADKEELHTRFGSLALQGSNVATILETELLRLDGYSREQLLA